MKKTKVFIPVDIFDKEAVGIVSIPTKNDCYVKEQEGYFFTDSELETFVRENFRAGFDWSESIGYDKNVPKENDYVSSLNIK